MTSVIDYLIALAKCTPAEHMVSDTEHSVVNTILYTLTKSTCKN